MRCVKNGRLKANQCFDEVIESGLEKLGKQISNAGPGVKIAVMNGLPWSRDGVVVVENASGRCAGNRPRQR